MCPRAAPDEIVVEVVAVRAVGPGVGFSGVVTEAGAGPGPAVGDEVFGMTSAREGLGSRVVCHRDAVAAKPAALAHLEAAALAAVGPAAVSAIRLSATGPGDRVMITGAGDDAGAIAVQIATARGSRVTAVCRDRDVPLVWDLGADEVIAIERPGGESARFAAVIDTDQSVTRETAETLLEPDGRLIAVRGGRVEVSSANGATVVAPRGTRPEEVAPHDLVALVEHDHIFPVVD
jgi:NADPH:quinone reductase-like Zn-dependent oxidoreductase